MGFHGYLLEFLWRSFCMYALAFNNTRSKPPQTVLRLLCRLHGFARSLIIPIHRWWIPLYIYRSMHSLLHVSRLTHLNHLY